MKKTYSLRRLQHECTDIEGKDLAQKKNESGRELYHRFDGRVASPICFRGGHVVLEIENYAPFLLNAVSSSWQRMSGSIYREEIGLGITDWRVIAMLAIEPNITAQRICEVVKLDKAAVSRTLKALEASGHVCGALNGGGARNRTWCLTELGLASHDQILNIALSNELTLVEGVPEADLEICLRVLRQMLRNLTGIEA